MSKKISEILLVDHTLKLTDDILEKNFKKIISFDYPSHKFLLEKNISHEISDNFLTDNDFEEIQNKSYQYSNWFSHSEISSSLEFENVNLGGLFYIEFFLFLLPFIKKIKELNKIKSEFPNQKFYSSTSLAEIGTIYNLICSTDENSKQENDYFYDTIKFKNNFFQINIPRKYFISIKKMSQKFFSKFSQTQKFENKNNVFFVEFNTVKFESLFKNLKKNNTQSIYFGLRRPAIWNKKSFSIVKTNNIHIVRESNLENKNKEFLSLITKIKPKINELFEKNFFSDYFKIDDYSFWVILKPHLKKLFFNRLDESIENILFTKKTLENYSPEKILLLSESGSTEQIVIQLAKKLGLKTILLQHGLVHDGPIGHKWNEFTGTTPKNCSEFVSWGNSTKNYLEKFDISSKIIHPLGNPTHDFLYNSDNIQDQNYLLLATQGPAIKLHVRDYTVKANEEYVQLIKDICKISKTLNLKLIIKLHPYEENDDEEKIAKLIDSNIEVIKKGDMHSLIKSCTALISVGTSLSTAILEAHIFSKPVLRIPFGEWMGKPDNFRPTSCLNCNISDLSNILKQFPEKSFSKKFLEIKNNFLDDYVSFHGNSSEKIAKFLKNKIS